MEIGAIPPKERFNALDLAVAQGIVVRTNQKRDGEWVYESQIYENSKL